jgi:hypothetical protein
MTTVGPGSALNLAYSGWLNGHEAIPLDVWEFQEVLRPFAQEAQTCFVKPSYLVPKPLGAAQGANRLQQDPEVVAG